VNRFIARMPIRALVFMFTTHALVAGNSLAETADAQSTGVRHMQDRAQSENVGLALQLVEVPGYRYVDPWSAEPHLNLPRWRRAFEGYALRMSWHSVVSSSESENRTVARHAPGAFNSPAQMPVDVRMAPVEIHEVGFLSLVELQRSVPADELESFLRVRFGGRLADTLEINGVHVFLYERTQEQAQSEVLSRDDFPNSRFWYAWERAGYIGAFDGADRTTMERWLRAYLSRAPAPAPHVE
jgi:hypothetical protein